MRAVLSLTRDDFPPNVADLSLAQMTLFAMRADSVTEEVVVTATRHTVNGQTVEAGAGRPVRACNPGHFEDHWLGGV